MTATGLRGLRNYQPSWLRADVIAGVTVAAYLVPQAMAHAQQEPRQLKEQHS